MEEAKDVSIHVPREVEVELLIKKVRKEKLVEKVRVGVAMVDMSRDIDER